MLDWNTETLWRCSACKSDHEQIFVAVKCHDAEVLAVVECSHCGVEHTGAMSRLAKRAAERCCEASE